MAQDKPFDIAQGETGTRGRGINSSSAAIRLARKGCWDLQIAQIRSHSIEINDRPCFTGNSLFHSKASLLWWGETLCLSLSRWSRVREKGTVAAESSKLTLVVLISGGGTNLQAMIDRAESGELDARIALVVSSNPEAYGLIRARSHGISTAVVDYRKHGKKHLPRISPEALPAGFAEVVQRQRIYRGLPQAEIEDRLARLILAEQEIIRLVDTAKPDVICLAGFMRLLSPYLISHYQGGGTYRIMNIHPALLPAFPGEHGYADTFSYGSKIGGITVHFVDEGEDTGPVIAQAIYPIWPEDTLELVRQRGLHLEYALYPRCIQWMAQGHLRVTIGFAGRPVVQILDPSYPDFLEGLIRRAFTRPA